MMRVITGPGTMSVPDECADPKLPTKFAAQVTLSTSKRKALHVPLGRVAWVAVRQLAPQVAAQAGFDQRRIGYYEGRSACVRQMFTPCVRSAKRDSYIHVGIAPSPVAPFMSIYRQAL